MIHRSFVALALIASVAVAACGKKEEAPPPQAQAPAAPMMPPAGSQPGMPGQPGMPPMGGAHPPMGGGMGGQQVAPPPKQIVVPDEVKKAWKSVTLQLTDKQANKTQDVKVDIGGTAKAGDLEIKVESFLPAFTMTGGAITSKSNETQNPAARVTVKEKGNQIYTGWLFSMYPDTHPMTHDKYKLILKDFTKS